MKNQFNWPLWHWHFETSSICTLKCPRCPRVEVPETLVQDQLKIDFFLENFSNIDEVSRVTFCGDDGDPIYAKDFIDIVSFFKNKNPETNITIITNGSYKKENWWEELGSVLNEFDQVHFSLDGWDQKSNEQYRVNCDWESITAGIRSLRKSTNAFMCWAAIAFKFNENKIDYMKSMASKFGFDTFQLTLSTKFGSHYDHYNTENFDSLEPSQNYVSQTHRFERKIFNLTNRYFDQTLAYQQNLSKYNETLKQFAGQPVIPLCKIGTKGIYVNSQGYLIPCCWIGNRYNHNGVSQFLHAENNIKKYGLEAVLNGKHWEKFTSQYNQLSECRSKCNASLVDLEYATKW